MTNKKIIVSMAAVLALSLVGCAGAGKGGNNSAGKTFNIADYPVTENMTQELNDALAHMGNEERLAYDIYMNLNELYPTKQFYNIATKSETKHIDIVQQIVRRYALTDANLTDVNESAPGSETIQDEMLRGVYDIEAIQDLYDVLYAKGANTKIDALEVGCMVEVVDVNDLNNYISLAQTSNAVDIEAGFTMMRDASYNHYWAFDQGLKNEGIDTGCCSVADYGDINFCKPDYPQNERGNR